MSVLRTCPRCGNYDPGLPRDELPDGARYCTPLSCDAWTKIARLTKQGKKTGHAANGSGKPACYDECRATLLTMFKAEGVEANVTHEPPLFATDYEQLAMRCPHGVLWYTEPTSEQVAEWVRTETP